jgi:hypothetical protein
MSSNLKARPIARRVSVLLGWPCSTRWMVRVCRPDSSASVSCVQPWAVRKVFTIQPISSGVRWRGPPAVVSFGSVVVAVMGQVPVAAMTMPGASQAQHDSSTTA